MTPGSTPADEVFRRIATSPDIYVHSFDWTRESALVVELSADAYRAASFLDQRVLRPAMKGAQAPLGRVVDAARGVQSTVPLHFIFHTGHVGSTLVSRLLEDIGGVLALREPLPLRSLAEIHDTIDRADSLVGVQGFDTLLTAFLRLWSRGYPATKAVVLKATSTAGRLAPVLMTQLPVARAIYLNLRAEPYLAILLGGQNSALDLRGHGSERARRLQALGAPAFSAFHQLSPGERAAMGWLTESWSQAKALDAAGSRMIAVDFDELLGDLRRGIERIVGHLGLETSAGFLDGVAQSPTLTRYAKGPDHAYSPQLRAQVLAQSRAVNAVEIRKGLNWLQAMAGASGAVANVVARAGL